MYLVLCLSLFALVLILVLPKLQTYMRMLVAEADEMEKLYRA